MGFPNKKEREKIREKMLKKEITYINLDDNPSLKFKTRFCTIILKYKEHHNLSSRELAELIEQNESRVSELVHYKLDKISIEKLISYVYLLNSKEEDPILDKEIKKIDKFLKVS